MLRQGGLFAPISREGALVLNNLFLTTACLTVFVGTLYPLALEAMTDDKNFGWPAVFQSVRSHRFLFRCCLQCHSDRSWRGSAVIFSELRSD